MVTLTRAKQENLSVHTLLCKEHLTFAKQCLMSMLQMVIPRPTLVVHSDGTLGESEVELLNEHFERPLTFISREEADDIVFPQIERFPLIREFRKNNPLAMKLIDVGLIGNDSKISVIDSDVLFLKPIQFLFPAEGNQALFMRDLRSSYSVAWPNAGIFRKIKVRRRINTGLFSFPRSEFDIELINRILTIPEMCGGWQGFMEQTIWAALAARVPTLTYDARQVAVVDHGTKLESAIRIAHFPTPVRYRLAEAGPVAGGMEKPTVLGVEPCGDLSSAEFLFERLCFRLRRIGSRP
jgi:hypothetical protein